MSVDKADLRLGATLRFNNILYPTFINQISIFNVFDFIVIYVNKLFKNKPIAYKVIKNGLYFTLTGNFEISNETKMTKNIII